jgi:hypothetical protein
MLTQARDLEVSETGTAVAAALLEADEIRRHAPPYNRALRTEGKQLTFISADFARTAADPQDGCRIGPLPGQQTAAALCALCRTCKRPSVLQPESEADLAAAFGFSPTHAPGLFLLREGIETFLRRHRSIFSNGPSPHSLRGAARRLWQEKMAGAGDAGAEAETEEEPIESPRAEPEWTPDRVADRLEGILCHAGRMIRRARWFAILGESSLAWAPSAEDRSFRNLVVFDAGVVHTAGCLAHGRPVPVPPGWRRPAKERRQRMDLAVYQRLRVATTEIRRLLTENRDPELRISKRVTLGPGRVARMLWWF